MFGMLRRTALAGAVSFLVAAIAWTDTGLAQVSAPASTHVPATVSVPDLAALSAANLADTIMPTAGSARPPIGYLSFCRSFPAECKRRGETDAVALTENLWTELVADTWAKPVSVQAIAAIEKTIRKEFF